MVRSLTFLKKKFAVALITTVYHAFFAGCSFTSVFGNTSL